MSDPIGYNGSYIDEDAFRIPKDVPVAIDIETSRECMILSYGNTFEIRTSSERVEPLQDLVARFGRIVITPEKPHRIILEGQTWFLTESILHYLSVSEDRKQARLDYLEFLLKSMAPKNEKLSKG